MIVYMQYEKNVCNFVVPQAYGKGREAITFTSLAQWHHPAFV